MTQRSMHTSAGSAVLFACALAAVAGVTWWWEQFVVPRQHVDVPRERWERVKDEYPMPPVSQSSPGFSSDAMDAIVRANPFSPMRHSVTTVGTSSQQAGAASGSPAAKFIYKGRVTLGQRHRGVVEETSSHKTYFLEVGQEVAGLKVLDIAENRVVLSDPLTGEEVVVSLATQTDQRGGLRQGP